MTDEPEYRGRRTIRLDRNVWRVREVAAFFRVHPHTVRKWAEQGKLKHFRSFGGDHRFYRKDVLEAAEKAGEK